MGRQYATQYTQMESVWEIRRSRRFRNSSWRYEFYDRTKDETIKSFRAALTVDCEWAPDGRTFLCATIAPRMNEGNQITMFKYTGEKILDLPFKPDKVEGRHEDTGAGARTKTQALLYRAVWRPDGKKQYQDRAASPPPAGSKRKKGLPDDSDALKPVVAAYRPKGEASGSVAAMLRGEIDLPTTGSSVVGAGKEGWTTNEPPKLKEWEIRKIEKERKKAEEKKKEEE